MTELTRREREILDAIRDGNTEPYSESVYLPTWDPNYDAEQETKEAPETAYAGNGCMVLVMMGALVAGAAAELIRYLA